MTTRILISTLSLLVVGEIFLVAFFVFPERMFGEQFDTPAFQEQQAKKPVYLDRFGEAKNRLLSEAVEWIEVNIPQGKIRRYEQEKVAQEFSILTKGDPQEWGGTPAGLYTILDKNKVAFSGIAQVYMPYAMKFYGKYYLHGEPYYPNGEKLTSDVSGGCIRLNDENAAILFDSVEVNTPVLVIDKENDGYQFPVSFVESLYPRVSAESYLVADIDSGQVLAERNSATVLSIASLTKLMTAVVVAENVDLRKFITIQPAMLEAYGNTPLLEVGKRFRVVELFYPALISSSNDAAEALAGFLGRERTIRLMNEKAKNLFMEDTAFLDPSGYDFGNASSAQDLFYLGRYIVNNRPLLFDITRGKVVKSFGALNFSIEELWDQNIFTDDQSFVGGKTGYVKEAKQSALFLFRFRTPDEHIRTIAFIVLRSNNRKEDIQALYGWLSKNYSLQPFYGK